MAVVIGIDPGVASTGFGVVCVEAGGMRAVDAGVISAPRGESPGARLARIHGDVSTLISSHRPDAVALEDLYFGRNVRSAIAVGQARGVVLLAAAQGSVPAFDYTPQAVKMAVCGSGAAAKAQVQRMVAALLGLAGEPGTDHASDALGLAICHAGRMRPAPASAAGAVAS